MSTACRNMTVRLLSLRSPEAGDFRDLLVERRRAEAHFLVPLPLMGRAESVRNTRMSGRLTELGDIEALGGE